jgi:hypothetical protein
MVSKEPKFNGLHHCADHQDQKDKLEPSASPVQLDQPDQLAQQDHKVPQVQLVVAVAAEPLAVEQEPQDHRDQLVLLALLAQLVPTVLPVQLVHKVHKVFKEIQVQQVQLETMVQLELQVQLVHKVHKVFKA